MAPFLANKTAMPGSWKWMLYGDDDTVFFPDNVLKLVESLDHTMPYFISDAIWYPQMQDGKEVHVHPNPDAPRCLPCGYAANVSGIRRSGFNAMPACPCTVEAACYMDNLGAFDRANSCSWAKAGLGGWYFIHGGSGAILSWGLMQLRSFEDIEAQVRAKTWFGSGDSVLTETVAVQMGILPTDPGFGVQHPNMRAFDPGWQGPRQHQHSSEDDDTEDWGNDPVGVLVRYAGEDVEVPFAEKRAMAGSVPEEHQAAVYLHRRLSELWQRYAKHRHL
ncbi:hypothetical protein WJX72_004239 [[Myrmecia] bisecta]|uniref:Hexosyltransferase n=1 Tax=[Myrmecia] bisecta TaxID=41462 RepID=A0AAW1Q608_9CHLO